MAEDAVVDDIVDELIKMLHEVYAVAADRGGYDDYDDYEWGEVMDRAQLLLRKHGVEV
jgi:hypothetical protein